MSDRKKIEKLVGMLGSEHMGEVFNAAQMLTKMAREENKTLVELLMIKEQVEVHHVTSGFGYSSGVYAGKKRNKAYETNFNFSSERPYGSVDVNHANLVSQLQLIARDRPDILNFWEKRFIESIGTSLNTYKSLTGKQAAAARDIIAKAKQKGYVFE